jgi:hypothetical protein
LYMFSFLFPPPLLSSFVNTSLIPLFVCPPCKNDARQSSKFITPSLSLVDGWGVGFIPYKRLCCCWKTQIKAIKFLLQFFRHRMNTASSTVTSITSYMNYKAVFARLNVLSTRPSSSLSKVLTSV